MRSVLTLLSVFWTTVFLAPVVFVAHALRIPERRGSIYERCMRLWARSVDFAAGVRVVVHGEENLREGAVYVANHVSWFDVFALAEVVPRSTWIAKAELEKLPIFGWGAEAAGVIFLERENRKSAFESYQGAAKEVSRGRNIIVCPEGTRGYDYPLRPFKKGPFVLAIAAQSPIVPTLVYGAREVMRKGSFKVRSGVVHVHFLEPIDATGSTYEDRNALVDATWQRIAAALESNYGIASSRGMLEVGGGQRSSNRTSDSRVPGPTPHLPPPTAHEQ